MHDSQVTLKKIQIKEYDRLRKVSNQCVKSQNTTPTESQSQSFRNNPNYYTIQTKSKQIIEILGDDVDLYCDVLLHVLMETRNSEQHLQKLNQRYVVLPACEYDPHSVESNPGTATKTVRQMAVLHSNKKHEKAKELAEVLKSQFESLNEIAKSTGENKCTVHGILSSPKNKKNQRSLHEKIV